MISDADPPFTREMEQAIAYTLAGVALDAAAARWNVDPADLAASLELDDAYEITPHHDWDSDELLSMEFTRRPDLLEGWFPVGVTLLSAPPKAGKSRLLTQLAFATSSGKTFLGLQPQQAHVLTLSLEDGARRYQNNLNELCNGTRPPQGSLRIWTASPRLDEGGRVAIEQHIRRHKRTKLVIVDVFERVRPASGRERSAYRLDYQALLPLQVMANRYGVAIVVVHHNNQRADVEDILEKVSGTNGLIGVVDAVMVLERRRGDTVGTLSVAGRDVTDQTMCLSFNNGWWGEAPEGMPPEVLKETADVRELWMWLAANDGASTDELADHYGRSPNATSKLLHRMEEKDIIDQVSLPAKGRPATWQVVRQRLTLY